MTTREAARAYRDQGLSVFPVGRDKRPLVEWKPYQRKLPEPVQIARWWKRHPEANVAVATGALSNLVVFDADGPEGLASLKALGTTAKTWLARTGRVEGGWHQFFSHPGQGTTLGNRTGLRPHLDVRADGGYIVMAPSIHTSGRRYEWLTSPEHMTLAPLPADLLALLLGNEPGNGHQKPRRSEIPEGQRNDHLFRMARSLVAKKLSADAILAALCEENRARCRPPLPDDEVRAIADHAATHPDQPGFGGFKANLPDGPCLIDLATIDPRDVEWLWPGRLAKGKLTLLVGEPDLGKSLISIDLAARLSTGRPWPDGTEAPRGRVIFMTAEDGIDDTIVPRLIAAGADLAMIHVLRMARRAGKEHFISLDDKGRVELENALSTAGATLLIVDPLSAYLGAVDTHRDAALRAVLTPFADLLDRMGVACLGLMHPAKQVLNVIYLASGSGAFTAQARVVLGVAQDPDEPTGARRLVVKVKGNLHGAVPTLAYRVIVPDGQTPALEWELKAVEGLSAPDLFGLTDSREEHSQRQQARDFIREFLADEPKWRNEVFEYARANGIADKTLYRAKGDLGVIVYKTGQPGTPGQAWAWMLPDAASDGC